MTETWPGHEFICGRTGSGKTHFVLARARRLAGGLLYIDPQGRRSDDDPLPWPRAGRRDDTDLIIATAEAHGVHYVTSEDDKVARLEMDILAALLMRRRHNTALQVVVDEAHIFAPESGRPGGLHQLARRGRVHGVQLIVVSQRPADVAKGIVTQCSRHIIFQTSWEGPYFARYGLPADEVRRRLDEGGEYSYVTWDGAQLSGPMRAGQ